MWESNPPKTGSTASHEGLKPWDGPAANHPHVRSASGTSHRDNPRRARDNPADHRPYVNPLQVEFLQEPCGALGIDHEKPNMSNVNRPIPIVDRSGKPIREVLA